MTIGKHRHAFLLFHPTKNGYVVFELLPQNEKE